MKTAIRALAFAACLSPLGALCQIGAAPGDTGPGQAIPFDVLIAQLSKILPSTGVTAGPCGSATQGCVVNFALDGRALSAVPTTIAPAFGSVTGQASLPQLPTIGASTTLCSVAGGTPIACTRAQLTALLNLATSSLPGALPAWPGSTTTYFRGDGSYATLNFAALGGTSASTQGGTGVNSPTNNAIYKAQGASPMVASALSDNGSVVSSSESIDITTNAHVQEIANAGTTGTALNKLAKLTGAPSTAVIATTSDTTGNVIGIVTGGAGTTGNAQIAIVGQAPCIFDGSITSGHYAQVSTTTGGDCHDGGATFPTSGQVLGLIIANTNASPGATPQAVTLFAPGTVGTAASSSGTVTNVATAGLASGGPITSTGTVTVTAAAKTDQQAGTSNVLAITPLHQQDHDSAEKAWVNITGSNGAIISSYGVSSVSRIGLGGYTITFVSTNFSSSASYGCNANLFDAGIAYFNGTKTATSISVQALNLSGAAIDPTSIFVSCRGR
jgi:hypothetical protein